MASEGDGGCLIGTAEVVVWGGNSSTWCCSPWWIRILIQVVCLLQIGELDVKAGTRRL